MFLGLKELVVIFLRLFVNEVKSGLALGRLGAETFRNKQFGQFFCRFERTFRVVIAILKLDDILPDGCDACPFSYFLNDLPHFLRGQLVCRPTGILQDHIHDFSSKNNLTRKSRAISHFGRHGGAQHQRLNDFFIVDKNCRGGAIPLGPYQAANQGSNIDGNKEPHHCPAVIEDLVDKHLGAVLWFQIHFRLPQR